MINKQLQREVGLRLKKKRKECGLTQAEVAEMMGVARNTTVSGWERGDKKLDNQKLVKLAQIYKVSIDFLLGHESEDKKEKERQMEELLELGESERWEKYALVVDGQKLTKGQTKRLIAFIRAERSIENE